MKEIQLMIIYTFILLSCLKADSDRVEEIDSSLINMTPVRNVKAG